MFGFDDPFGNKKADTGRDPRRSFTASQKKELQFQQGGKCALCHKQLDPRDIEFDHKKAWADKGRTTVVNGRALCGSCHNKVSHGQHLKKAEKKAPTKKQPQSPFGDLFGTGSSGKKKKSPSNPFGLTPPKKGKGGFGLF
jgi:hypothetical protein